MMNRQAIRLARWIGVLVLGLLFLATARQASAQGQTGIISGSVTDQGGAVLKGAQVSIESQDIHVVSDEQGLFLVSGLAPGNYTVTINYVGFAKFEKTVDVAAGQKMNVDAALQIESKNETVLVTGERTAAELEAVNIGLSAENLVEVLPAGVIRSLPNANMADALGRLPSVTLERDEGEGKYVQIRGTEPRLTNATVDGVNLPSPEPGVRQIKFDAIPADIVDSVQVNKTLQANMDGDGIGGSVNMVTKTATNAPTISLDSMGGYTPIVNGRGLTEEGGTIGKRFGTNKKFGILFGGSYDWNGRGIDDIEPVPDVATLPGGGQESWKDAMDIREYRYFRSRWGLAGSADYKLSSGSDIYLRGLYSDFHNYGDRWAYTLTDNTPGIQLLNSNNVGCKTNGSGTTVGPCSGAPTFNAQLRNPDIAVGSVVLGGSHVLATTWYTWDVSVGRSFYGNSPYSTATFDSTLTSSQCQYDPANTSNQYLPRWTAACYTEGYNPSNLYLNNIQRDLGPSAQVNLQAGASMAKRYHLGGRTAIFEFGGKFRNDHKFDEGYVVTISPNAAMFTNGLGPLLSQFPNRLTNTNYYNGGNYNLGYNGDYEDAIAYANANSSSFTSSSTQGRDGQEFNLVEKVSAGYLMNTIDFSSRVSLVTGVRFEATSDAVSDFAFNQDIPGCTSSAPCIVPAKNNGSYLDVLPSASLRYAITSNNYLRLIYGRGLARPDYDELAEAENWTTTGNGANRDQVTLGNPGLKAEVGDDIDVLFEHSMNPFGEISVGYFYKYLSNPIVINNIVLQNYLPPGVPQQYTGSWLVSEPINAGHAWIQGVEAEYLQHLGFLPGAWAGLGISANYGYADSRAYGLVGRSDHPRLARTSPNTFNISPTYDRGRISIRVGLSYNGASIDQYQFSDGLAGGVKGPLSDIYFYPHIQLDAQGSVRMARGLSLVVYGQDLNNGVFGFYQGSPQYMIQREYYQPTVAAGVHWSPSGK
jgi:TonB-dependent receptor